MNQYLKAMTATEQVGAMFLIVFGCLTVAGIVVFLLSIREHAATAEGDTRRVLLARADGVLRSSWVMAIVFWVGWLSGDTTATVLFALVSFFALREFLTLSPTRRATTAAWCWPSSWSCRCSSCWWAPGISTCSRCSSRCMCSWRFRW